MSFCDPDNFAADIDAEAAADYDPIDIEDYANEYDDQYERQVEEEHDKRTYGIGWPD